MDLFRFFPLYQWKKSSSDYSRKQFPLTLAYALTIHKSQGLTLENAVIKIGRKENSAGLTYVAMSRVKEIGNLIFNQVYPQDRFLSIRTMRQVVERENLLAQMISRSHSVLQ